MSDGREDDDAVVIVSKKTHKNNHGVVDLELLSQGSSDSYRSSLDSPGSLRDFIVNDVDGEPENDENMSLSDDEEDELSGASTVASCDEEESNSNFDINDYEESQLEYDSDGNLIDVEWRPSARVAESLNTNNCGPQTRRQIKRKRESELEKQM